MKVVSIFSSSSHHITQKEGKVSPKIDLSWKLEKLYRALSTFIHYYFFTLKHIFEIKLCSFTRSFLCVLTGNLDWVGNEFTFNAGAGLVISQPEGVEDRNSTVVDQLRASFERDWFSRYTRSLQANKIPVCNKHQNKRLVSGKSSHIDNGPVPIRTGQHDNGPAPMRNNHRNDGQTPLKTRPHDDRLTKTSRHGMANGLGPVMDSYQDRGRVKTSHLENRQVQIKDNHHDNPMDPRSQSAESSGSREISNRALWPQSGMGSF